MTIITNSKGRLQFYHDVEKIEFFYVPGEGVCVDVEGRGDTGERFYFTRDMETKKALKIKEKLEKNYLKRVKEGCVSYEFKEVK